VLAGHTQKGIPAFSIYGRDVQDGGDKSIPAMCKKKFSASSAPVSRRVDARKSYLGMGASRWALPVPSWTTVLRDYLGMRSRR